MKIIKKKKAGNIKSLTKKPKVSDKAKLKMY